MTSLLICFWLNKEECTEKSTVDWPSGVIQEVTDRNVNRLLKINESEESRSLKEIIDEVPQSFALSQNYPNPFNPETTISYDLLTDGEVKITIFNLSGQTITLFDKGMQTSGSYELIWDSKDNPSGIYFYRLQSGEFSQTKKMNLLR